MKPPIPHAPVPSSELKTRNISSVEALKQKRTADKPLSTDSVLNNEPRPRQTWKRKVKTHFTQLAMPSFPKNNERITNMDPLRSRPVIWFSWVTQLPVSHYISKKCWRNRCSEPSLHGIKKVVNSFSVTQESPSERITTKVVIWPEKLLTLQKHSSITLNILHKRPPFSSGNNKSTLRCEWRLKSDLDNLSRMEWGSTPLLTHTRPEFSKTPSNISYIA